MIEVVGVDVMQLIGGAEKFGSARPEMRIILGSHSLKFWDSSD